MMIQAGHLFLKNQVHSIELGYVMQLTILCPNPPPPGGVCNRTLQCTIAQSPQTSQLARLIDSAIRITLTQLGSRTLMRKRFSSLSIRSDLIRAVVCYKRRGALNHSISPLGSGTPLSWQIFRFSRTDVSYQLPPSSSEPPGSIIYRGSEGASTSKHGGELKLS